MIYLGHVKTSPRDKLDKLNEAATKENELLQDALKYISAIMT